MHGGTSSAWWPLALGIVSPRRRRSLRAHLRGCARCRRRWAQSRDEVALLGVGLAPAVVPQVLREEVLHALGETSRFRPLWPTLAAHTGLDQPAIEHMLARIDWRRAWHRQADGHRVQHIPSRPDLALVRLPPGARVPLAPGGRVVLLQGQCVDGAGNRLRPGQAWQSGSVRAARRGGAPTVVCVAAPPEA